MARETSKMLVTRNFSIVGGERREQEARHVVEYKWSVSRGRNTYGYNICTAFVDGVKVGSCNGGGYDMQGAALSGWITSQVASDASFYGLTWHDPNYKTSKKVEESEQRGESLGLERYQEFYSASSKHRTELHTVPHVDGACGLSTVLGGAGFQYHSIPNYTSTEVREYLSYYVEPERRKGRDWEAVAKEEGFRRKREGRGWERWPKEE
jgi:hypothetical protein